MVPPVAIRTIRFTALPSQHGLKSRVRRPGERFCARGILLLEVIGVRILLLALIGVLSALPVGAAPGGEPAPGTQVIGDGVIVAGQRVGPLRLTMSLQQLIDTIGVVYKREEFKEEKIILYEWRAEGIWGSPDLEDKGVRR